MHILDTGNDNLLRCKEVNKMAQERKDVVGYLDDIPFKISDQCFVMRTVNLPFFDDFVPSEYLKDEYSFDLERKVLLDAQEHEEKKKQELKAREELLKNNYENNSNSQYTNDHQLPSTSTATQPTTMVPPISWNMQTILEPQPMTKPETNGPEITNIKPNNFNLSDFENDTSSPFDYVELQTINDIEELNTVFQGMNTAGHDVPMTSVPSIQPQPVHQNIVQTVTYPTLPSTYAPPYSYYPPVQTQNRQVYTTPYSYTNSNNSGYTSNTHQPNVTTSHKQPTSSYYVPQLPTNTFYPLSSSQPHYGNFPVTNSSAAPHSAQVPMRSSKSITDLRDYTEQQRNGGLQKTPSSLNLSQKT